MTDSPVSAPLEEAETDEALMMAFAAGAAEAFDRLYARHRGAVYRFFLRQLAREDAEEAHQETWMRIIGARTTYRPTSEFRRFLFTVAHNVLTDHWRRQSRRPPSADDGAVEQLVADADPVADTERAQRVREFSALLAALPAAQREAFLLREEGGLTSAQIAAVTHVAVEAVNSRIRYAIRKLKGGLARHEQS